VGPMKRVRGASAASRASKRGRALGAKSLGTKALVATAAISATPPLFNMGEGLVQGTVLCRPSARNKSPYVGDVTLPCGRVAIAHMPSMDMGGKCLPGVGCLLRTQVDKKSGLPIGADAVGKYGTPKCEFVMQALWCAEAENGAGCWVGAHPSLGEKAALALLEGGRLSDQLIGGAIEKIEKEVTGVAGTDMRADFVLTHAGGQKTVMEVKTVVDTDYDPACTPPERFPGKKCVFLGHGKPYSRAAIFPWGNSNQKGPDGEKVVSARAIKHVRELTAIAEGVKALSDGTRLNAAVLFIVVRRDAQSMRPNEEACPSFARYLREAKAAGVQVLAQRVAWGDEALGEMAGTAIDEGPLSVEL